jgi:hypothetical protein
MALKHRKSVGCPSGAENMRKISEISFFQTTTTVTTGVKKFILKYAQKAAQCVLFWISFFDHINRLMPNKMESKSGCNNNCNFDLIRRLLLFIPMKPNLFYQLKLIHDFIKFTTFGLKLL